MKRLLITSALLAVTVLASVTGSPLRAASSHGPATEAVREQDLTPEQRMARRHPQPAQVRALVGRPVLDDYDNTIGYVQRLVRSPDGKIVLIVRYGGWFGWIGWWQRPVALPIERVALIGPNVAAIDMPPEQFAAAPTWQPSATESELAPETMIRVAITRR